MRMVELKLKVKVGKIQIEGKDFFDGDTKLAAQNLPAKAVGKIEVLRNFTEVGQLSGVQNNEDNFASILG